MSTLLLNVRKFRDNFDRYIHISHHYSRSVYAVVTCEVKKSLYKILKK